MSKIQTSQELAQACLDLAKNYKTLYVLGCIGAPMTEANKTVYLTKHCASFNSQASRKPKIQAATADTFGFDCVCMIKSLLWGWSGNTSKVYGGATYASNNVPDIDADYMIKACKDVSTDFSKIEVGEALWIKGHIGVYIGDGLAVECTYRWNDGVQITAVHNIGTKAGYNGRSWTKHGKLPYVTYEAVSEPVKVEKTNSACTLNVDVLRKGDKGEAVKALQILLIGNGYSCGSHGVDGSFGSATDQAVRAYQKANGLTVDGIVGTNTWSKILGVK